MTQSLRSSEGSGAYISVDTTFSFTSDESDVTFFSPSGSPRVLDSPEIFSVFSTVTNESDTVVKRFWVTEPRIRDTSHVGLEMSGVDSSGEWTYSGESRSDSFFTFVNHNPRSNFTLRGVTRRFAGSIFGGVCVVRFQFETGFFEEFESVLH
jgi:hypothetical protein